MASFQQPPPIVKWVHSFKAIPEPQLRARLICFHWAGGNGMIFRPLSMALEADGIEVKAIMLPGRLARAKDPFVTNMAEVIENIYRSLKLQGFLGGRVPVVFFGHSLGSLIAYELTKFIEQNDGEGLISHLILSGTNSPWDHHMRYIAPQYICKHLLNNDDLLAEVMKLGGMEGVAPELVRMALPVMRADFTVLETYRVQGMPDRGVEAATVEESLIELVATYPQLKIKCPLSVVGGGSDSIVSVESLLRWKHFACDESKSDRPHQPVLKPNLGPIQPFYNIYIDPTGSHFYFMDKSNGGEAWFNNILKSVCLPSK